MHELGITGEIIKIIEDESRANGIRPSKVILELGADSSYKEEPLKYYYDILKKESDIVDSSELKVEIVDGQDLRLKEMNGD